MDQRATSNQIKKENSSVLDYDREQKNCHRTEKEKKVVKKMVNSVCDVWRQSVSDYVN